MALSFVQRVPVTKNDARTVDVVWQRMEADHVRIWADDIQPFIRRDPARADQKWNWRSIYYGLDRFHALRDHSPMLLAGLVEVPGSRLVPVGMLFLLTDYPRIDASPGAAVFTYFLTSAPWEALRPLGVPENPTMGRALIDCGLVLSVEAGKGGHTWLHCHPKGKARLMDFYENRAKLLKYSRNKPLGASFKQNDGRYFYTNNVRAEELILDLNWARTK